MTKKIRSKKNNLLNYFIHDHKYLSKEYLKSCEKFFKSLKQKQQKELNMYNLILYIGVGLIVGGFLLFLYSEMRLRQLEIEEVENQKFIDALIRTQQLQNIRRDIKKI
jgi:3-hydroxy-3-methylglutaryl CoA synthase